MSEHYFIFEVIPHDCKAWQYFRRSAQSSDNIDAFTVDSGGNLDPPNGVYMWTAVGAISPMMYVLDISELTCHSKFKTFSKAYSWNYICACNSNKWRHSYLLHARRIRKAERS